MTRYSTFRGAALMMSVASSAALAQATTTVPPTTGKYMEQPATLVTVTGTIYGTLEMPAATRAVPVVLIIAGSGPTDRDGNSRALPGQNNSLKLLADGLAAHGIASVRYDKRGIAASASAAGKEEDLRFGMYVDDAAGWLKQLRADKRFTTVSVAGHSEGSLIGMIAARQAGADGYISLEGAGRKPAQIIVEQITNQVSPEIVATSKHIMALIEAGLPPDTTTIPPMLAPLFRPSVRPYLVSWFKYDPALEIAKLKIPALVVQGTTDIQTSMADAKALANGYPSARFLQVDGMNHVLKKAPPGRADQMPVYSDPTIPVVPKLIDEMSGFVNGLKRSLNSVPAAHPPIADTFVGSDKVKHFLISGFVETVGFSAMQLAGAGR
ncbi:MAG: alpha/beta hydrolase, partial [Gemmatimonadaceae bacterium]